MGTEGMPLQSLRSRGVDRQRTCRDWPDRQGKTGEAGARLSRGGARECVQMHVTCVHVCVCVCVCAGLHARELRSKKERMVHCQSHRSERGTDMR